MFPAKFFRTIFLQTKNAFRSKMFPADFFFSQIIFRLKDFWPKNVSTKKCFSQKIFSRKFSVNPIVDDCGGSSTIVDDRHRQGRSGCSAGLSTNRSGRPVERTSRRPDTKENKCTLFIALCNDYSKALNIVVVVVVVVVVVNYFKIIYPT